MRNGSMHLVRGLSSPPCEARAIICILPTNGRSAHREPLLIRYPVVRPGLVGDRMEDSGAHELTPVLPRQARVLCCGPTR
jgi:hypothetical protein